MTDTEQLIQRFIDQELSPDERLQFVIRLAREQALRDRVIELEQIVRGAGKLPRPAVPDGFVSRVMEQTGKHEPALSRSDESQSAPRGMQWNLRGALAIAALLLFAVAAGFVGGRSLELARQGEAPAAAGASAAEPTVLVRLVVLQPGAQTVQVAGDFNEWNPARTPLEQITGGAWTVTLPLKPGRYEYQFVVDGQQWIADPLAVEHSDDGFGSRNAVLDVRAIGASM